MTAEVFSITADRPNQETLPLMAVARESDVKNVGMREQNLLSLSYGKIVRKDINSADGLLPASFETYQIVEPGMTVLRFTDLQNDQRSLRSGLVTERGIITSAYVAVDPFAMNPQFFAYLMRAYDTNKVFYGMGGGVRQSLNFESIRRLPVPLLPADEQRAIADYLDQETAQIDALVAKQEEFIGLLKERRSAEITSAVTQGADGASGVESRKGSPGSQAEPIQSGWYRDVPTGWIHTRVKSIAQKVTDGAHISPETDGGKFDFVSTRDLKNGVIDFVGSLKTSPETYDYMVRTGCRPERGDVLFSKDGTIGVTAVVAEDHDFAVASSLIIVSPNRQRILSHFLNYAFASRPVLEQARNLSRGAGLPRISVANLSRIELLIPPVHEQEQIVEHLNGQTSRIDTLIAKAEEHIALAKERRSALITAAVTGQFDVRTARKAG